MVGGATESLNVGGKDKVKLYLIRRKGFIKLALQHGRDLVPVFGFGENEIYDQVDNPKGSRIRKFQEWLKDVTTFTLPLFHGRGIFQYHYGLVPFREGNSMEFIYVQTSKHGTISCKATTSLQMRNTNDMIFRSLVFFQLLLALVSDFRESKFY